MDAQAAMQFGVPAALQAVVRSALAGPVFTQIGRINDRKLL